jgi:SAM-dependent methyltransferase
MTDVWSERAQAFRESAAHREGEDLDLVVELCEARAGVTALDVATGGGHVARRLREAGASVVTVDPAPGMQPDVIARAEDLPFADSSFDVVVTRIAPHHFRDIRTAVAEMSRVTRDKLVVCDNLFCDESSEQAERLRDPTHVRNYSQAEWRVFLEAAGLEVDAEQRLEQWQPWRPWLERVDCTGEEAARVIELLGDRVRGDLRSNPKLVIRGRKREASA